jgi:6-phosphogluconolactonase
MKLFKKLLAPAFISLFLSACQKDSRFTSEQTIDSPEGASVAARGNNGGEKETGPGHVYTLSNQTDGNKVLVYRRAANGMLSWQASYATGGTGSGTGLGNQGAVILGNRDDYRDHDRHDKHDKKNDILLAINAGSHSISLFSINSYGLRLKSRVNSGGMTPVSITQHGNLVYVLNAGGNGNIAGFRIGYNGRLHPVPNSSRPLSSSSAGAAQIQFTNNGKVLVITEKATNKIITYTVNKWGEPGDMHSLTAANATPFGFDEGRPGNIIVSEAAGGAPGASTLSSYKVGHDGSIALIDGPDGAKQSAACWVVITNNGKFAYTTNTASDNISTFAINKSSGHINVQQAIAATTQAGPIDAALSRNSKFLYVLNGGGNSIDGFRVGGDGDLTSVQTVSGLPAGANGLAAE